MCRDVQLPRPLVHLVLLILQAEKIAELQLDLTQVVVHDGIQFHITVAAWHPIGLETIAHPLDVVGLHARGRPAATRGCGTSGRARLAVDNHLAQNRGMHWKQCL